MRFVPARNDMFDGFFDDVFPAFSSNTLMRTDVREKDGNYMLDIDLPGNKKEDIKISLYNGNLTISAEKNESREEKDEKGSVIRKERYTGSCSRQIILYDQARTFTVREAARIQSFPDDFVFAGSRGEKYKQIGNAVPVLFAEALVRAIKQNLRDLDR